MSKLVRIVSEAEFRSRLVTKLTPFIGVFDYVVGPGRSGAVAAVYASHFLGIPFVPYKCKAVGNPLVVDTASMTGRTIRKASRVYDNATGCFMYLEGPRVKFWYEELSMSRGTGHEFVRRLEAGNQ